MCVCVCLRVCAGLSVDINVFVWFEYCFAYSVFFIC